MKYPLPIPSNSAEAFWAYQEKKPKKQNPALLFDRFMPDWIDRADTLKEEGLNILIKASERVDEDLLEACNERWEETVIAARGASFPLQTDWRLIVGLGRKGSLEVGFTFHRYGFPYLPGSSLKGLARTWGLIDIASQLSEDSLKRLQQFVIEIEGKKDEEVGPLGALEIVLSRDKEDDFIAEIERCGASHEVIELGRRFRAIFGTTEHSGHVIFFDGIPRSRPMLEIDIMNPHYPDYYKEVRIEKPETYPTSWQNPNPVKFLTVASGTVFRFAIGWRRVPIDVVPTGEAPQEWRWFKGVTTSPSEEQNELQKLAKAWLKKGLLELGAGGKTSAGYGYFLELSADAASRAALTKEKRALAPGYERGVVKEFGIGPKQSYGFIVRSNGADIFVHRNNLAAGLSDLKAGQKVIFKVGRGKRGPQAIDVQLDE